MRIAYQSRGGPSFNTSVLERVSGYTERISRWVSPKYRYDIAPGIRTRDNMVELLRFYLARRGIANGFRFFDHMNHTSASNGRDDPTYSDVQIGVGDGATTQFQLIKVDTEGSNSTTRNIYKPIHGETLDVGGVSKSYNVLIGLAGVASASGWTVDTTSGVVTFSSAPGVGVAVTAGFAFDVPVFFGQELDEGLLAEHQDFDVMGLDSIMLEEMKDAVAVNEEMNFGGAYSHGTVAADFVLSLLQGRLHQWVDNTGVNARLPALSIMPTGGPMFLLLNGGSATTQIQTSDGLTNVITCPPGTLVQVYVGVSAVSAKQWVAF